MLLRLMRRNMMMMTSTTTTTTTTTRPLLLLPVALLLAFYPSANAQTCTAGVGTYCPSTTGVAMDCPAGYYCPGTDPQNDHVACPTGTYNALTGQSSEGACTPCAGDTVTLSSEGNTACHACPAGSLYTGANTCTACAGGTSAASGAGVCTACAPGYTSAAGAASCQLCRPGSYASASGSSGCVACPSGQYTFTSSGGSHTAVWGATAASQCVALPVSAATPLVCLPGTRMQGAACPACPIGYFCPQITTYPGAPGQTRSCPAGMSTATTGALAANECTLATPLVPLTFAQCAITPGDVTALTALQVLAVTATRDTDAVYFATATAVYRLFLQSNSLELLAGGEGLSGSPLVNAVGHAARFTSITAIAVDLDGPGASVVVVGDGNAVRAIDVYTRQVILLGTVGDIASAGGIALRRDPSSGGRFAYVSDASAHRILAFSIDAPTRPRILVVGDIGGGSGYQDAYGASALFKVPMGLAFLERDLNTSRVLLVADSGNGVIRAVDTTTRIVQTWFAPRDTVTPELSAPVGLSVSPQGGIVYVADTGTQTVGAIQMPNPLGDASVKLWTPLLMDGVSTAGSRYTMVLAHGALVTGAGSATGYNQLLALEGAFINITTTTITTTRGRCLRGGGSDPLARGCDMGQQRCLLLRRWGCAVALASSPSDGQRDRGPRDQGGGFPRRLPHRVMCGAWLIPSAGFQQRIGRRPCYVGSRSSSSSSKSRAPHRAERLPFFLCVCLTFVCFCFFQGSRTRWTRSSTPCWPTRPTAAGASATVICRARWRAARRWARRRCAATASWMRASSATTRGRAAAALPPTARSRAVTRVP
jgi:hypothetical protein